MTEEKFIMFRNRLTKVFRHVGRQAKRLHVTCYRVYDHDLPEFPFCIEIYEDKLYVAEYKRQHGLTEEQHRDWIRKSIEVMSDVFQVSRDDIFLKQRKVKGGRTDQYKKGAEQKSEFVVQENNLKFIVNLSDYLDTGLFLDHRITREMVKKESVNKKVLNLFCYTGSFSVYAAAGMASEVHSVDLSKTYLQWAEENLRLNGFKDPERFKYFHADVLQYLDEVQANSFDLIVLDPPTFSNSKRMNDFLDIQRDHVSLINKCMNTLRAAGILFFSTNYSKFIL